MGPINLLSFCLPVLFLILYEDHSGCCMGAEWRVPQPTVSDLQAIYDMQSLVIKWPVSRSALPGESNTFEIQVGRTESLSIVHNSKVSADAVGEDGMYTWKWTSALPLECASHSVRIRRFYNETIPSTWSNWMTKNGTPELMDTNLKNTLMFPYQKVLREGSNAMLCCIPARGVTITKMTFNNRSYPVISLGRQVKAIAVQNLTIPKRKIKGVEFSCVDSHRLQNVCLNYVSFPPQKLKNLTCMTADLKSVTCTWDPGRKAVLSRRYKRTHTLYIKNQTSFKCAEESCNFQAIPGLEEYHISVVVRNQLGEESEDYSFNIFDRVFPALEWDKFSLGLTDTTVSWIILGNLSGINFLCQVKTNKTSTTNMVACRGESGRCSVKLEDLFPNTRYTTTVRCAAKDGLWGDWTPPEYFTTFPLVRLDIWRVELRSQQQNLRDVSLSLTLNISGSVPKVGIRGDDVQWSQEGHNGIMTTGDRETGTEISIGPGHCDITVRAVIEAGLFAPSHIIIPSHNHSDMPSMKRIEGTAAGGFQLAWAEAGDAVCGSTVVWSTLGSGHSCTLQQTKVPTGHGSLFLPARYFDAGCRYTFYVYDCTKKGHKLREVYTGYSKERSPVELPRLAELVKRTSSSGTLLWENENENDPTHPGFITGYLITVQETGIQSSGVVVEDPHRKFVTIEGLYRDKGYIFHMSALTKQGPRQATTHTVIPAMNYSAHLAKILTPLFLLLGALILLWLQRKMLKSRLEGILIYPAGMNIRPFELDSFLHETSEKLGSLTVEECACCDIEILHTKPPISAITSALDQMPPNTAFNLPSVPPFCPPPHEECCPQTDEAQQERPFFQRIKSIVNRSYVHNLNVEFPFEQLHVTPKDIGDINGERSGVPEESWNVMTDYITNDIWVK